MSIHFPQGFNIISTDPIDERLILSQEQMVTIPAPRMPDTYFCICKDDMQIYIYDKNNEFDPQFGHFKKFNNSSNIEILTEDEILALCPVESEEEWEVENNE